MHRTWGLLRVLGIGVAACGACCNETPVADDAPQAADRASPDGSPSVGGSSKFGEDSRSASRPGRGPAKPTRARSVHRAQGPPYRPADVRALASPSQPACSFETAGWTPPAGYRAALYIHPQAEAFGHLRGGAFRLLVPEGTAEDAVVELEGDGLRLRGLVRADRVDSRLPLRRRPQAQRPFVLRASRSFVVGGIVAVTADTIVSWRAAAPGRLAVTLPDTPIRFAAGAHVEVRCGDLSLDGASFERSPSVPTGPDRAKKRQLHAGRRVRVAPSPAAKPMAWLWLTGGDRPVVELERTERRVRVLLERPDYALFGWIKPSDFMSDELPPLLGASSMGLDGMGDSGFGALSPLRAGVVRATCSHDVALIVDMASRAPHPKIYQANYAIVGQLVKDRPFRVRQEEGQLWQLWRPKPLKGLALTRGRLTVDRAQLESCALEPVK